MKRLLDPRKELLLKVRAAFAAVRAAENREGTLNQSQVEQAKAAAMTILRDAKALIEEHGLR